MNLFLLVILFVMTLASCTKDDNKAYYKVTFETNGGTTVNVIKFSEGEKIEKPTNPTKENARFLEWCTDEKLENVFDFNSVPESKDFTLYAKWNVDIIFETNGGDAIANYERDANDMVILPPAVDQEGRQFLGWYLDSELTEKADNLFIVPNHSVKLYAKWANIEKGTTINFLNDLVVNEEEHYTVEATTDGITIKPTVNKTKWSFLYAPIMVSLDGYTILHVKFSGTEGSQMTVKLEGGGVNAIEQIFNFTGEVQDEYWIIPEENIATEQGQRILIFVDGSKDGNDFDTIVTINALEFCRLKGSDEEVDQAIIFNSNGGSKVESIVGKYNTPITMPENPTKAGFVFDGWYKDAELTVLFTETKMPMGPTTLYAKWIDAPAHKVTFVTNCGLTLDEIEVKEGLVIPTEKLEYEGWEFVGWYRDEQLTDSNLVMDTEDVTLYAKWKTLKDLSDLENPHSLMNNWIINESGTYNVVESENSLTLKATTTKGKWSYISREISEYNLKYTNVLHLEFNGVVGRKIIVKYNNKVEFKVTITSEHQEEWLLIKTPVDSSIKVIVFYAPNQTLTEEETITFTKFEFLDPIDKYDTIDIKKGWVSPDPAAYEVTENETDTTITATTSKGTWSFVRIDLTTIANVEAKYIKALILEVTGPKDHTMIVKYNNAKEQKIILTGEKQKIEIKFESMLDFSLTNHLIIFIDGGKTEAEDIQIVFTKLELKSLAHEVVDPGDIEYRYESVDVTTGWTSPDEGAYIITESEAGVTVVATPSKKTWSVIKYVFGEIFLDGYSLKVTVTGPAGKYLLIKYNGSKEQKYELTGEKQVIELDFAIDLDMSKPLYMFIEPGQTISENVEVVFEKIELIREIAESKPTEKEEKDVNLMEGWTVVDQDSYIVSNENEKLTITATPSKKTWSVIKLPIDTLGIDTTVSFKIKVTGPAGHTMIFKYNNKVEKKIEFTGELQEIEIPLTVTLDTTKALYIFIDGGKTLTENISIEIESIIATIEVSK